MLPLIDEPLKKVPSKTKIGLKVDPENIEFIFRFPFTNISLDRLPVYDALVEPD